MNDVTALQVLHRIQRRLGNAERLSAVTRQCLLTLALAMACQTAFAQAMYRIKPFEYLGGCTSATPYIEALNEAGQATGQACNASGDLHAFLWKFDSTPMVDLGPEEVGSTSNGTAISPSGLVAGSATDTTGSFAFASSGNGAPMTRIYNTLGGSDISAFAVNNRGQLTGYATTGGLRDSQHAFVWKNDGSPLLDLGIDAFDYSFGNAINAAGTVAATSGASTERFNEGFIWRNDGRPIIWLYAATADFINKAGQVTGIDSDAWRHDAYLWSNDGTQVDLGTLGGYASWPRALNDAGQVAGSSYVVRFIRPHAFVWLNNGTPMRNLGTFGGSESQANDINDSGQVTGYANIAGNSAAHAFLWRNDGTKIQDLNALLDPGDPLKPYITLTSGVFIDNAGDIVADGTDSRTGEFARYVLQGTVLMLSPRALAFASQPINKASAPKSVTLTNSGPKVVAITGIALASSGTTQFALTNNCGASLAGHAACTIKVTFRPTTKGAKSATLNVNGGGGGLRSVALTGTGT